MAKVVLTEEQLKNIQDFYILNDYIGVVNESIDFNKLWNKYKAAILMGITAAAIFASISKLPINNHSKERLVDMVKTELAQKQDSLFRKKVNSVSDYMITAVKNQGYNPENLQLSPEEMVKACDETGFDLPLLMAQAHLESCFGFGRRARETGSVFSVGCYDNGKNAVRYDNQNESIRPYIRIMLNNYLNNKDINQLLSTNGFVNKNGQRYASDKNYENKVNFIRRKIISKYPELI